MRIVIFLSTLLLFFSAHGEKAPPAVGEYVNKLVDQVSTMLADKSLSDTDKVSRSKELLSKNLDFDWMANYVLNAKKNGLSQSQAQQFHEAYSQYVIRAYASLVKNYHGEKTIVKKVYEIDPGEYIVDTEVARPGKNSINVDYLIHTVDSSFKISDIITEGVSLINSQQDEFRSVLTNNGFEKLLNILRGNSGDKKVSK